MRQALDTSISRFNDLSKQDIMRKIDELQEKRNYRPLFPQEVMDLTALQDRLFAYHDIERVTGERL